jgi:hypothetical protein
LTPGKTFLSTGCDANNNGECDLNTLKKRKLEDLDESCKLKFMRKAQKKVNESMLGPEERKMFSRDKSEGATGIGIPIAEEHATRPEIILSSQPQTTKLTECFGDRNEIFLRQRLSSISRDILEQSILDHHHIMNQKLFLHALGNSRTPSNPCFLPLSLQSGRGYSHFSQNLATSILSPYSRDLISPSAYMFRRPEISTVPIVFNNLLGEPGNASSNIRDVQPRPLELISKYHNSRNIDKIEDRGLSISLSPSSWWNQSPLRRKYGSTHMSSSFEDDSFSSSLCRGVGIPTMTNPVTANAHVSSLRLSQDLVRHQYSIPATMPPYGLHVPVSKSECRREANDAQVQENSNTIRAADNSSLPFSTDLPLHEVDQRRSIPLATDEDENWLSEFLCFIRSELVEVFSASEDDVASRINSKKVVLGQAGIRCRHCAHFPHNKRSSRSSSFPSSLDRIYQSLTMMIRDHFIKCPGLSVEGKSRFIELKSKTTQGATDSKRYWIESAKKLGMEDSENQGIRIKEPFDRMNTPKSLPSTNAALPWDSSLENSCLNHLKFSMVRSEDKHVVSEYIFFLMTQVEKVYLTDCERVGNRKSMEAGMPGFGCKHCCATDRKGLCRFFPSRRRTLPAKIKDLADHLRRCSMCPPETKIKLKEFQSMGLNVDPMEESNKHFFDRVWARLHLNDKIELKKSSDEEDSRSS